MALAVMNSKEDTRFLSWIALEETYQDKPWVFLEATSHIADDLRVAMNKGIKIRAEGQAWTIFLICTGVRRLAVLDRDRGARAPLP